MSALRFSRYASFGALSILLACCEMSASPLVSIGDSVDILFKGETGLRYDSNLFRDYGGVESDFIYTLKPGFQLNAGEDALYSLEVNAAEEMLYYRDHSGLNQVNEDYSFRGAYDGGGKTTVSFSGDFETITQNTATDNVQGALIRRRQYGLGATVQYEASPKTQLELKPRWSAQDYRNFTELYRDQDSYEAGLNAYYRYSPVLKVGLGYRPRYTDFHPLSEGDLATDRSYHFFNFRVDGEITPRLKTTTAIGWQVEHMNGGSSDDAFALDSSFTYTITQRLQAVADLHRDFAASGTGRSIEETGVSGRLDYQATNRIFTSAGAKWTRSDYQTFERDDDEYMGFMNAVYGLNQYVRLNAGYNYVNNDSTIQGLANPSLGSYHVHILSLSASVLY